MKNDIIIITGCDAAHFNLCTDMVQSFRDNYDRRYDLGFINFSSDNVPFSIRNQIDRVIELGGPAASFDKRLGYHAAYTGAKARLPGLFPGYELYIWVDADCWFCNAESLGRIVNLAAQAQICIHPEYDIHYRFHPTPSARTLAIYRANEGPDLERMPVNMPMLNSGVVGMSRASPIWKAWAAELDALRARHEAGQSVYFSDQIALHKLVFQRQIRYAPMRAIDNWVAPLCLPVVRREQCVLTVPTPPFERIGVLHLAARTKDARVSFNGHKLTLRYRDIRQLFAGAFDRPPAAPR